MADKGTADKWWNLPKIDVPAEELAALVGIAVEEETTETAATGSGPLQADAAADVMTALSPTDTAISSSVALVLCAGEPLADTDETPETAAPAGRDAADTGAEARPASDATAAPAEEPIPTAGADGPAIDPKEEGDTKGTPVATAAEASSARPESGDSYPPAVESESGLADNCAPGTADPPSVASTDGVPRGSEEEAPQSNASVAPPEVTPTGAPSDVDTAPSPTDSGTSTAADLVPSTGLDDPATGTEETKTADAPENQLPPAGVTVAQSAETDGRGTADRALSSCGVELPPTDAPETAPLTFADGAGGNNPETVLVCDVSGAQVTDPLLAASTDETSMEPKDEAATHRTPVVAVSEASSAGLQTGDSHCSVGNRVVEMTGLTDIGRDREFKIVSWEPEFEVQEGNERSFAAIKRRAELVRAPLNGIPLPTGYRGYGTTAELFSRLQSAMVSQALVSAPTSTIMTHWSLSSWFSDALAFAPGLVIVGPAHEAGLVLRALRAFCRNPLLLTRADISSLQKVRGDSTPTLLFYDPSVSKQMASILTCSTSRGYMVPWAYGYKDFYGPKAIYVGEEAPIDRTPRCSLQVRLNLANAAESQIASRLDESIVQDLQNQLQMYRQKNLVRAFNSKFDAVGLTSENRMIANALGACIVDSPELQSELVSLLMPVEQQRQADRSMSPEGVTVEAILNLAHAGMAQILVGEVAAEVNRISEVRGERLRYNAERIGHIIKKLGLVTRRLGKAGRGLVLDVATTAQVHKLAAAYCGVGLDQDEKNLHCPLCAKYK